ncbi:MAG: nuclear transport factor 2 family protein [Oscillatoria sp. SIO1A7]|nr:nuclear transport factor 2 family protein [Oscillatoria sp. SIO1A7]
MNPEEIRAIIRRAADACSARDAESFAGLFAETGEIILSGETRPLQEKQEKQENSASGTMRENRLAGKAAIQKATVNYLAVLAEVKIEIRRIVVEGEQAAVEWRWCDRSLATGRDRCADNAIFIEFNSGLIARWREYKG